jgi:hypothetical protein
VNRLLLGLALVVTPLTAQQPRSFEPIDSGKVIRFQVAGVVNHGRLLMPLTMGSDSVRYCRFPGPPCQPPIEPWQIGRLQPSMLEHLDVQVGTKAAKGAWIGGVVGAVLGYVAAGFARGFCEGGSSCPSDTDVAFIILTNTAVTAGIGALIGSGSAKLERRF